MRDLPDRDDPFIGQVLQQRYEILACIGVGAMGQIYRCYDQTEGTEVAIKVLRDELTTDPEVMTRFEREVQATRDIHHRNVVEILGSGIHDDGQLFLVMELLQGEPAVEYLKRNAPLSSRQVCSLGVAISTGLHACHVAGIIHRDLKPENVVVIGDCEDAKIFDFGLLLHERDLEPGSERLTGMDIRIGTPMYMSPEYIDHGQATVSCDLYALGVVLYEAATGHPLFEGASYEVLHHQVHAQPIPIEERAPGLHPAWLRAVIESLLQKDPADRPQSGAEIAAQLRRGIADRIAPSIESSGHVRSVVGLVVAFALLWHVLFLISNLGNKSALIGGDLITSHYAVRAALAGNDPYQRSALQDLAASEGIRRQVPAIFQPPSHLLIMGWSALVTLDTAHAATIALNEWTLAGVLCILALWWRPLGSAVPVVLAATVAAMTAIPIHHQAGQHQLLLLALTLLALWADQEHRGWSSGALLGLACAISLRPAIIAAAWIVQRRYRNLMAAAAVFTVLQGLAVAIGGIQPAVSFWTVVFPHMLMGQLDGAIVQPQLPTNHAIASLTGIWGSWLAGTVLLGGAAYAFRARSADPLTNGARAAALCLLCILLPVFGRELHLVWALPATAVCVLAVHRGRIAAAWAPLIGVSVAVLCYPMKPLASLHASILEPALPLIAPLILEIKLVAMLALFAATVVTGRTPDQRDGPIL